MNETTCSVFGILTFERVLGEMLPYKQIKILLFFLKASLISFNTMVFLFMLQQLKQGIITFLMRKNTVGCMECVTEKEIKILRT